MIKIKEILSTTNIMILIIMAGGNLLFGLLSNLQEFKKMDCVREAIYHKMQENDFTDCLLDTGIFNSDGITWVFLQFVLILVSIVIASFIEGKNIRKSDIDQNKHS